MRSELSDMIDYDLDEIGSGKSGLRKYLTFSFQYYEGVLSIRALIGSVCHAACVAKWNQFDNAPKKK